MNKKTLQKLSLILFVGALFFLALAYFFFHFVTDEGITLTWHPEAGKPFVTDMIGIFGVNCLFGSAVSLLAAYLFFGNGQEKNEKDLRRPSGDSTKNSGEQQ